MEGFFTKEEVDTAPKVRKIPGCGGCRLYLQAKSPKMPVTGRGRKRILIVAEAPGETEDERNEQLIGDAGQLLREELLDHHDIDLDEDCWKTNALICRPPGNRTPTPKEIDACRPNLYKTIQDLKPHLIVPLGGSAVAAMLAHRVGSEKMSIGKWRGWNIPDRTIQAWVCPTLHPSYILRQSNDDVSKIIWRQDLARAFKRISAPLPVWKNEQGCVRITRDPGKVGKYLGGLLKRTPITIALDWETSGRKPHNKGHHIRTVGISEGPEHAVAFPLMPENIPLMREVLECPDVQKIAQDIKFEHSWAVCYLKCSPKGWLWCTLQSAHVIDNREMGINGLKFLSFVIFGVPDYATHLDRYLKTSSKNANKMNRVDEAPLKELLTYNGIDAMLDFRLALYQMEELDFEQPGN